MAATQREKDEISRPQVVNKQNDIIDMGLKQPPIVGPKLQDRQFASFPVLLISQTLIGCDKSIEINFRFRQQLSVFQTFPPQSVWICAFVGFQVPTHWPRHTLTKQNSHAASKAASERSSTFTTNSLETDGKHSKNSSKV